MKYSRPDLNSEPLTPELLLQLQRQAGNQAVLKLLRAFRQATATPAEQSSERDDRVAVQPGDTCVGLNTSDEPELLSTTSSQEPSNGNDGPGRADSHIEQAKKGEFTASYKCSLH